MLDKNQRTRNAETQDRKRDIRKGWKENTGEQIQVHGGEKSKSIRMWKSVELVKRRQNRHMAH
jgi:hypothetical protein